MQKLVNSLDVYLKGSAFMAFLAAFLGGVLTSFTPCVYPMVPITAGYVGSRNLGGSKVRGFVLSLFYVVGVAVTFRGSWRCRGALGPVLRRVQHQSLGTLRCRQRDDLSRARHARCLHHPHDRNRERTHSRRFCQCVPARNSVRFCGRSLHCTRDGRPAGLRSHDQRPALWRRPSLCIRIGYGTTAGTSGHFFRNYAALPRSGEWMVKIKKVLGLAMIGLGEYFLIKMGQLML